MTRANVFEWPGLACVYGTIAEGVIVDHIAYFRGKI